VPEASGRLQVACARYGPDALLTAESLVTAGVRALHALLDVTVYDVVAEPVWHAVGGADAFADVNTPDDAASLGIALPDG
jgi:molybdopterin-guanine dinucleotide biosynthesis protein A